MGIHAVGRQLLAEVFKGRDILHGSSRHGLVIVIDLGHITGCQLALQLKNIGLDLVAVDVQGAAGGAQQLIRLFDDDGVAVPLGPDLEHIVDVSVADLNTLRLLIRFKLVQDFDGVALDILCAHQEKFLKVFHSRGSSIL